jgi:ATP-dependent protease ClpP protease subunit
VAQVGKFFEFQNVADRVALYIYGEIAGDQWGKWTDDDKAPSDFARDLAAAAGKPIDLYINSPGGSVFGGMAIYNQLKRHAGSVTAHVDGLAASIASVIMLAADKVIVPSNALVMIHEPSNPMVGYYTAADMRGIADALDRVAKSIVGVYVARMTKPDEAAIQEKMAAETWLNGS